MDSKLKEELTDQKGFFVYSFWIVCYRYYLNTVNLFTVIYINIITNNFNWNKTMS